MKKIHFADKIKMKLHLHSLQKCKVIIPAIKMLTENEIESNDYSGRSDCFKYECQEYFDIIIT